MVSSLAWSQTKGSALELTNLSEIPLMQMKRTESNLITNTDQVYKLGSEGVLRLIHIHHPYLGRDLEEGAYGLYSFKGRIRQA